MAVRKLTYSFILLALIVFKVFATGIHLHLHHKHGHGSYQHFGLHHSNCGHEHHHENDNDKGHDDEDDCKLCENAMFVFNAEFSLDTALHLVKTIDVVEFHQPKDDYTSVLLTFFLNRGRFVRPPPPLS